MEIRPIQIDRLSLEDGIGRNKIVGYQYVDGRELEILNISADIINDGYRMITITEEALQDIITLLNNSISKGDK